MEHGELDETPDLCDSPQIRLELATEMEIRKDSDHKKRKREDDIRKDDPEDILRIKPPQVRTSGYEESTYKRFRGSEDQSGEKLKKKSHHESERLERLKKEQKRLEIERHQHLDRIQKERDREREVARKEKSGRTEENRKREDRKRKSTKNSLDQDQRKSKHERKECRSIRIASLTSPRCHQKEEKKRDHKKKERRYFQLNEADALCFTGEKRIEFQGQKKEDLGLSGLDASEHSIECLPKYDLHQFARSKFDVDDDEDEEETQNTGNSGGKSSPIEEREPSFPPEVSEENVEKIKSLSHEETDDALDDDDDDDVVIGEMKTPALPCETEEPTLPPYYPAIQGCRNVEEFHCLNRINEGTYGVVYRAVDLKLREVVALKRLKMEKEKDGFPITSLREIKLLMKARHPNIVTIKEVVVGSNMDKIYLVMEYVEHDMKSLMESMKEPFTIGEVKTLVIQLLRGVQHLHDNWIIHRDLKTSNLLLSHSGILKIGDFGLAREYGSPLKPYTPIVVTLWYRSPELLLGTKMYSTAVDMWSVGCIFGEFLLRKPLFPGSTQIEQLNCIFKDLGSPNEKIWPGMTDLPGMKKANFSHYQFNQLRRRFGAQISEKGFQLMNSLLTYCPEKRLTADGGLTHEYFNETPLPTHPNMFPTWPAKSELCRTKKSPKAPSGGKARPKLPDDDDDDHLKKHQQGFPFKFPAV